MCAVMEVERRKQGPSRTAWDPMGGPTSAFASQSRDACGSHAWSTLPAPVRSVQRYKLSWKSMQSIPGRWRSYIGRSLIPDVSEWHAWTAITAASVTPTLNATLATASERVLRPTLALLAHHTTYRTAQIPCVPRFRKEHQAIVSQRTAGSGTAPCLGATPCSHATDTCGFHVAVIAVLMHASFQSHHWALRDQRAAILAAPSARNGLPLEGPATTLRFHPSSKRTLPSGLRQTEREAPCLGIATPKGNGRPRHEDAWLPRSYLALLHIVGLAHI